MRAYATKYNTSKGANFRDDRDYLFPIPQGERDKSNNILSQNPGFNMNKMRGRIYNPPFLTTN